MEQRIKDSFIVDENAGKVYWKNVSKHHSEKKGKEAGSMTKNKGKKRCVISLDGKKIKRSHIVYIYSTGKIPNGVIDHINRDSSDDRIANLRDITIAENNQNHSRRNIREIRSTGKFQVRIGKIFSKNVETLEEAIRLYDKKRRELWKV